MGWLKSRVVYLMSKNIIWIFFCQIDGLLGFYTFELNIHIIKQAVFNWALKVTRTELGKEVNKNEFQVDMKSQSSLVS